MSSIPLRARITLVVLLSALAAGFVLFTAGSAEDVETTIVEETLRSTSEALNETDRQVLAYGVRLQDRIESWVEGGEARPFDAWLGDEVPGLIRKVVDQNGEAAELPAGAAISVSAIRRCRTTPDVISCSNTDLDGSVELPAWASDEIDRRADGGVGPVPLVIHGFVVSADGDEVLVYLEVDVFADADSDVTTGLGDLLAILALLLLFGLVAVTWFALGRALGPVAAMTNQVDQIGAENLDQRVAVPQANDELRHLAETMNRMLDRLEQSGETHRRFVSDASHELRSPITAIRATMEVASNRADNDWQRTASVVQEENDRLAALVDDLLLLARMDEEPAGVGLQEQIDLEELCLAEAERPRPVGVSVRVVMPARIRGDEAALARAIRNLVDNAAAHAESSVSVEIDQNDSVALVRVRDDGPGIPPTMVEKIFERFVRVDESRARSGGGGAGLGLAIARHVAERHGGRLTLAHNSEAGATFELTLPLVE